MPIPSCNPKGILKIPPKGRGPSPAPTSVDWVGKLGIVSQGPHLVLVSGIPTDPLFFKKGKKKKKKGGVVFRCLVAATPFFCNAKERWAWPRHCTPTDRPAVERDSRDTGNKVFLLVGLSWRQGCHSKMYS